MQETSKYTIEAARKAASIILLLHYFTNFPARYIPRSTIAIETTSEAATYAAAVSRSPAWKSCKACDEKVEKVVKPPQKPTTAKRCAPLENKGMAKPIRNEPMTFTASVAQWLQIAKCAKSIDTA